MAADGVVTHVVLLRVRVGVEPEKVDAMLEGVRSLAKLDGVLSVTAGADFTLVRGKGYTHALVVRLESRDALLAYGADEYHQKVIADLIKPIVEDVLAVDYFGEDAAAAAAAAPASAGCPPFYKYGGIVLAVAAGLVAGFFGAKAAPAAAAPSSK
jgi:hypothetical protein